MIFGGIEAGGTKFVCGVGTCPRDMMVGSFPTTSPEETVGRACRFFQEQVGDSLRAVGIASFGPVDLEPESDAYGFITSTPKPGWQNYDFAGTVRRALQIPVGFDTDVNAAALAESHWGAAQGFADFIYLTVGTGIGGGAMVAGRLLHGLMHPEMGHIRIPHRRQDPFPGNCPFHEDCLEGLASGWAIRERWGKSADDLPNDHPAWELEAHYLGLALSNFICTLSPQRIIMGGGVMERAFLFPMIRRQVQSLLNGYVQKCALMEEMDKYVVPPHLRKHAGVLGAILLAQSAAGEMESSLFSTS